MNVNEIPSSIALKYIFTLPISGWTWL